MWYVKAISEYNNSIYVKTYQQIWFIMPKIQYATKSLIHLPPNASYTDSTME
jgi:hypothetical protein